MAQVISISPGVAAGNGLADIIIPANQVWHIGIYTDHADGFQALGPNQSITVWVDTPSSSDTLVATLTKDNPKISLRGQATVRTKRGVQPAGSANIGAYYNSEA